MTCAGPECTRPVHGHGLCNAHWRQRRDNWPALQPVRVIESPEARFWSGVDKSGDCWTWSRSRSKEPRGRSGYGYIGVGGRLVLTHRFSWELHNGPIPAGMDICHRCDNPPCVRPDHLFVGTRADNMRDCRNKGRLNRPARLSASDVVDIRSLYGMYRSARSIAAAFGVTVYSVYDITRGRRRQHGCLEAARNSAAAPSHTPTAHLPEVR